MKHSRAISFITMNDMLNYSEKALKGGDKSHQYIVGYGAEANTHRFIIRCTEGKFAAIDSNEQINR